MIRRLTPWLFALGVVVTLSAWSAARFYPPLPNPLTLEVTIPRGERGQSEPLIASGRAGAADFLFVRWLDPETVVFGYDSWGSGGPLSAPINVGDGTRHLIEIEMPGLNQVFAHADFASSRHLRILDNGTTVVDADVEHYVRDPQAIWFGANPIGGSSCQGQFTGKLWRNGRPVRGGVDAIFTARERLVRWFAASFWQITALVVFGGAIVFAWPRRGFTAASRIRVLSITTAIVSHRWFVGTAAACAVCFACVETGGTFKLNYPETFGSFYDFQAASLLHGRLDVPEEAISGEAFNFAGKHYGYFGVTPALLRLPFVIFDFGFGNLSRTFMLVDYAGCLVGAYLLLLLATRVVRGPSEVPSRLTTLLVTANVGLGSTIFFLGSRAYIYHEAILCGVCFALFACWCALKHLAKPTGQWWIGSLACGVLSVHARPPTGLFALTFLGAVALAIAVREGRPAARRQVRVAALAAVGVFSFNGLSYLKFHTFEGAPLRMNVQYTPARLARIGNKNFHVSNLRFNTYTYLVRPNLNYSRHFPWVYLGPSKPKPLFPEAKSDFSDPTLAFPFAMPALFMLATAGCVLAASISPTRRPSIAIAWLAIVPMALAMFMAIATVHRYTADFCPFLITTAVFGFAALETSAPKWRRAAHATLIVTTVWTMFLTAALTLHYQGKMVWGVPDDIVNNYARLRAAVDGHFGVSP